MVLRRCVRYIDVILLLYELILIYVITLSVVVIVRRDVGLRA